jgi:hypothetical protein
LHEIKSRAEQAEMILLEITNDPKKLEFSNARIDGPSETFFQLNKLVDAVHELEKELRGGEYDYFQVIAELLEDVHDQMTQFKQYGAITQVELIYNKVEAIENELKRQIQWSFREIGSLTSSERYDHDQADPDEQLSWNVDLSSIKQAYMVVDVLGEKFRNDLLERFAQLQLISYDKLFQFGTKYSDLESLEQRFAWFKYLLHLVDEKLEDTLPSKWPVTYHLYIEFARRTKKHLHIVLTELERTTIDVHDQDHIAVILKAIKSCVAFENEISASFPAKEILEEVESPKTRSSESPESLKDAFDPFLSGYVYMERAQLEQLMKEILQEEEQICNQHSQMMQASKTPLKLGENGLPAPGDPYDSSKKMFEYIKGALKRCTSYSTGMAYLSLSKEFRVCLHQYAESLKFRCPTPTVAARGNKPAVYTLTRYIEFSLCRIITTSEYCIDTIPALETMMKQRIKPEFTGEVEFGQQIDVFNDLISFTINVLILGEINRMEKDFQSMKSVDWARYENVGDVGGYIKHAFKIMNDCIPRIRLTMSSALFFNVCNNLCNNFLDNFLVTIYSLKRISKSGAAQLLLDLNGVKEYFEKMPNVKLLETDTPLNISRSYTLAVNMKIKKVENILKLICADDAVFEENVSVLWPEATKEDIDKILVLKGNKMSLPSLSIPVDPNVQVKMDKMKDQTDKLVGDMKDKFGKMTSFLKGLAGDETSSHSEHHSNHGKKDTSTHTTTSTVSHQSVPLGGAKKPNGANNNGSTHSTTPKKPDSRSSLFG